jgi:hypothetical protein
MDLTDLAAFLGPIGGLGIGASVGAFVAYRLGQRAERKRAEGELYGLLRLVSAEAAFHQRAIIEDFSNIDQGRFWSQNPGRSLSTDTWEQVRQRVAQLLPANRFASLAEYYLNVQHFNNLLDEYSSPLDKSQNLQSQANAIANELVPEIRGWMEKAYIGPISTLPTRPQENQ